VYLTPGVQLRLDVLGVGSFKRVYKAFDNEEGSEVAWNEICQVSLSEKDRSRLATEISLLKEINHPHVIKCVLARSRVCVCVCVCQGAHASSRRLLSSWVDNQTVVFITELMTSGTLREFIRKNKSIKRRNIKRWCSQILHGLAYLHGRVPKIVHRDVKCDNIFIDGHVGEVKIGDLGLSTTLKVHGSHAHARSLIGTPEFMAPEVLNQRYTEAVDIYAFGMCVVEMVTGEYPYRECRSVLEIISKLRDNVKPLVLGRIVDSDVKYFINQCLAPEQDRPSAKDLLRDPFLEIDPEIDNVPCVVASATTSEYVRVRPCVCARVR
jgi:WNK lysine deficient protein kinase